MTPSAHPDLFTWAGASSWDLARRALTVCTRLFIWGPPGVGKSYLTLHLGRPTYQVTLCEDLAVQELIGHYVPDGREFTWHDGPVALAMRQGAVLVLNEITRASGAVQDFLLGILDNRDVNTVALPSGERLRAIPSFVVVATSNTGPESLNPALRSRFDAEIHLSSPNPELVFKLNQEFTGLGDALADSFTDPDRALDPRKLQALARLIRTGVATRHAAAMTFGLRAPDVVAVLSARGVRLQ